MTDDVPTVLVVEDEEALVELYVRWLGDDYEVRTASGGDEAMARLDEDVDVALLDRLMPGMSGDEVLERIDERDLDCKVAMVSAVEPDFDVITMGFDDYLTKPVDREELLETVRRLLARNDFADLEQELYSLVSKQSALRTSKPTEELEGSDEFEELEGRIETIREDIDAAMPGIQDDEFVAMVRDIEAEGQGSGPDRGPGGDGQDADGGGGS